MFNNVKCKKLYNVSTLNNDNKKLDKLIETITFNYIIQKKKFCLKVKTQQNNYLTS